MTWSTSKSYALYQIKNWAESYFNINDLGHICAKNLNASSTADIDLYALAQSLKQQGLQFPILVRLIDVLHNRVKQLHDAFSFSIKSHNYQGNYISVYPIKVNQQYTVVKHLLDSGDFAIGLEAGSKPELIACIAMSSNKSVIICNGYKDKEYIRLALMAKLLGHKIILVLEKPSEVKLIQEVSKQLNVKPELGVRVRLNSTGAGNWQNTGGEKSKFGFSATGILDLIDRLTQSDLLSCLTLLHFHLGSQIANIKHLKLGLNEAMQYFVQLSQKGLSLSTLDVGGGLAVDYEGSHKESFFSMNYGLDSYAETIVKTIKTICAKHDLADPEIITEAGRAMTAHHGVLISNVIDKETKPELKHKTNEINNNDEFRECQFNSVLLNILETISNKNYPELLTLAKNTMNESVKKFVHGGISIEQRSNIEFLYFQVCRKIKNLLSLEASASDFKNKKQSETIYKLNESLADNYIFNISIFQSIPDVWGLDQVFPIVPLHKLDQEPSKRVILNDLTCDSDGRIDKYANQNGQNDQCTSLRLHAVNLGDEYLLGVFLVGAYQEILGDMHNLFGDTHSVDVSLSDAGLVEISNIEMGDQVSEVLRLVHYDTDKIMSALTLQIDNASIDVAFKEEIRQQINKSLTNYTYLDH